MGISDLSAPKRVTTTQQAYEAILRAILSGDIPAGEPLRLKLLSERLGMSMMPVREAIRQLESVGVIEVQPHRGARVREVSTEDLEDTHRTRIVIEGALCHRAAQRFTAAAADAATAALDRHRRELRRRDFDAARDAHKEFHYTIYRAADSMWLLRTLEPVWNNSERYRAATMVSRDVFTRRRQEHEAILAACVEHDPDAARAALRAHLLSTVEHIDPDVARRLAEGT